MAFPDDPLGARVELQVGNTWTDVTGDAKLSDPITINHMQVDAGGATCTLTLDNKDGRYSPRNPISPYYGLIGRNTPIRVSVNRGDPYLSLPGAEGDRASTPDDAALDITGDLDIRIDATLGQWYRADAVELAGKFDIASGQKSWNLYLLGDIIRFRWTEDGASNLTLSSTQPYRVPSSGRLALRVTLDADDGFGGSAVTFYTAESMAGPWTQLGDVRTYEATSVYAGTAPLHVGDVASTATDLGFHPADGKIHAFELRSGINGTVVASPDFTAQPLGTTSFVDSAGRTWTLEGDAEITNRRVRFHGEVASWPTEWSTSGQTVWVPIAAAGINRRKTQGTKPLASTLRRRIPSFNPVAYWPMEEDSAATQAYSPITGVQTMSIQGLDLASVDTLNGSQALPKVSALASFSAVVPAATDGSWQMEMVFYIETAPTTLTTVVELNTTGTARRIRLQAQTGNVQLKGFDAAGAEVFFANLSTTLFFGRWNRLRIYATQSGGNTTVNLVWIATDAVDASVNPTTFTGTAGHLTAIGSTFGPELEGMAFGHLAVFDSGPILAFNQADDGFNGETSFARALRLADEESIPLQTTGVSSEATAMGAQRPGPLVGLLQQCADSDGGILSEMRERLGYRLRHRRTMYHQAAKLQLDYTAPGLAPGLKPVDDDAATRNDVTVARIGGSAGRAVLEEGALSVQDPNEGVGRYDESVSLSLGTDGQAEEHAYWRLYLGTRDETRYPRVAVNLARGPHLIDDILELELRDRITIANPPPWQPPGTIDLLTEGYTEVLGIYTWTIDYVCSPGAPWNTAVTDGGYKAETDGSELAADIDATQTSISVAVTAGHTWTTDPAEMPVDIRLGGEVMTVTAITGAASPQTFTVVRSVNGISKAHSAGSGIRLAQPTIAPL